MKRMTKLGLLAATLATVWGSALADINVGVVVSATGPAASLGIPEKNTVALMPRTVAGQKVNYIILDDASDTTAAVANTRKLISEQGRRDPGLQHHAQLLAMVDVVSEAKTPMITLAASAKIVEPVDAKKFWVFKTPQHDAMMAAAIGEHMAKAGIKTVGYIGFNDAYGESWLQEFRKVAEAKGLKLTATEAYSRSDTSVTGQTLKLMAAKPDAVLIAGSGTPAALPQKSLKERGYQGKIYQTHGVANADFLRVGGKDVEGTLLPAGPVLVAHQLPDSNPVKKSAVSLCGGLRGRQRQGHGFDLWRAFLGCGPRARSGDSRRAQEGPARHGRVPRRAARCAGADQGRGRRPRHLQHDAHRPPGPGPARGRHGQDRERYLEVPALNLQV